MVKRYAARVLGIVALTFAPLAVVAETPHYSFAQIHYGGVENGPSDGNTYGIGAQFGGEIFQVGVAYDRTELDFGSTDLTANEWTLRGGLHGLLGEPADLVGNVGYFDVGGDFGDSGFFLDGGVRWMAFPMLEVNGFITHVEPNDSDSDQIFSASAIAFIKTIGIGISYATANDADFDEWRVFVRFNFGDY